MKSLLVFALLLAAVAAAPKKEERIVGGSVTTINNYPFGAVVLFSWSNNNQFSHKCGGTIINNRSAMSAAHCFENNAFRRFRLRVGSTNSNSGGTVYNALRFVNHPTYRRATLDCDIAVLRVSGTIALNTNTIRAASLAGSSYNLADNQPVWAIGWGAIRQGGPASPQLRHVQIRTVNQQTCRSRYTRNITGNMLCAGMLDVGGRDTCQGDSGGPLIHNNVIVGVTSFGNGCARPRFPGVYARVSVLSTWVRNNA